jgi:hypothetical protein
VFRGGDTDTPLSNMTFLMALRRMGYRVNKDQTEAAYLRSDDFEQRRELMGQWATFACTPTKAAKMLAMQKSKNVA